MGGYVKPQSVSQTGVGTVIVPLDHYSEDLTVQAIGDGVSTFQVDASVTPNVRRIPAGNIEWEDNYLIASGVADTITTIKGPVTALRLNVTAGVGTIKLNIAQTS